jgi:hypothetical protein
MHRQSHPSNLELLKSLDDELAGSQAEWIAGHISQCPSCRERQQRIVHAGAEFERVYGETEIPPAIGARARLRARLAEISRQETGVRSAGLRWAIGTMAAVLIVSISAAWLLSGDRPMAVRAVSVPDPVLTPGATVLVSSGDVCRESNLKNKEVPVALRRRVFEEYGIAHPQARAYEVDYLITPALGGADDIHNLWPQSYSDTAWNAEVKDALEDHLRDLVCAGEIDLATAQRELAANWIDAYKKYFHTDHPLRQ